MSFRRFTLIRGILAVATTTVEETAIWAVWRFLLPDLGIELSVTVLIIVMSLWLLFSIWLFVFTTFFLKRQKTGGPPSMIGQKGKAAGALTPHGMVRIKGELWSAESVDGSIAADRAIKVVGQDRMNLRVTELDSDT